MKPKFTPGPWEIASGSAYRVVWVEFGADGKITDCELICDTANNAKTRTPENAANARLISAAPEMYEAMIELDAALMAIQEDIDTELVGACWCFDSDRDELDHSEFCRRINRGIVEARAAIAKAEGR